ncbi:hypothetical protein BKA66DRAFT_274355 [Pyrenochaeta sp. MPI-SDFR-AT-0127]|nr:hypothetical protein BKA66DRAFT_274355 [Pyrenochaeta sp. MPI-SDFR-AT-0127]
MFQRPCYLLRPPGGTAGECAIRISCILDMHYYRHHGLESRVWGNQTLFGTRRVFTFCGYVYRTGTKQQSQNRSVHDLETFWFLGKQVCGVLSRPVGASNHPPSHGCTASEYAAVTCQGALRLTECSGDLQFTLGPVAIRSFRTAFTLRYQSHQPLRLSAFDLGLRDSPAIYLTPFTDGCSSRKPLLLWNADNARFVSAAGPLECQPNDMPCHRIDAPYDLFEATVRIDNQSRSHRVRPGWLEWTLVASQDI